MLHFLLKLGMMQMMALLYLRRQPYMKLLSRNLSFALLRFRARKDIAITTTCKSILTFKDIKPS
jgi:hypothetical protein